MKGKRKLHVELSITKEMITEILDDVSTELIGRRNNKQTREWFKKNVSERLEKEIWGTIEIKQTNIH